MLLDWIKAMIDSISIESAGSAYSSCIDGLYFLKRKIENFSLKVKFK